MSYQYDQYLIKHKSNITISNSDLVIQVIVEAIKCKDYPTLPRNIESIHAKVTELYSAQFECITDGYYLKSFDTYDDLHTWLRGNLLAIPEIEELNLRQREYDEGLRAKDVHGERPTFPRQEENSPNEDFIDLDAYCRNIAYNLTLTRAHETHLLL